MNKILSLIRGVSGSGKSTLAKKHYLRINGFDYEESERKGICQIFETDFYFENHFLEYSFNANLLKEAHEWNVREIARFFNIHFSYLKIYDLYAVCSNTFTTKKEICLLLEKLDSFGVRPDIIEVLEPKTKWWLNRDVGVMINKNSHGVPLEVIYKQINRWQHIDEGRYEYTTFLGIIKNENSK